MSHFDRDLPDIVYKASDSKYRNTGLYNGFAPFGPQVSTWANDGLDVYHIIVSLGPNELKFQCSPVSRA